MHAALRSMAHPDLVAGGDVSQSLRRAVSLTLFDAYSRVQAYLDLQNMSVRSPTKNGKLGTLPDLPTAGAPPVANAAARPMIAW
jgi:hypothetical protein